MENTVAPQPPISNTTIPQEISPQSTKFTSKGILLSFVVLFLLLAVTMSSYYLKTQSSKKIKIAEVPGTTFVPFSSATIQQVCTMEAKICPDGSSVGRSGSNCEFVECPTESSSNTTNGSRCGQGYRFLETQVFEVCVPELFEQDFYKNDESLGLTASYKKKSSKSALTFSENFIGGWGANPCLKTEQVQFMGKPAQQVVIRENLSNSEPGDPNARCGQPLELLVSFPQDKWAISFNGAGEVVSLDEFSKARETFALK